MCPFKNEHIGQMYAIKGRKTAFFGPQIQKVNKTSRMDVPTSAALRLPAFSPFTFKQRSARPD
jgi:hypothetical protein